MKNKVLLLIFSFGLFAIAFSIIPKKLYAEEGGTMKGKEEVCICNYGPHLGDSGKHNVCSSIGTKCNCYLVQDGYFDEELHWHSTGSHWDPVCCKFCSYTDCDGEMCSVSVNPE